MFRSDKLLPLLAVLFLGLAVPASAQVYDTFIVPAVINGDGANGTVWSTDLSIFNPQAHTLKVSVSYYPTGLGQGAEVLVTVPSNQTFTSKNVLADVFKLSGTGSLVVATFAEDNPQVPNATRLDLSFVVRTTTFNNAKSGTFGQGIDGVLSLAYLGDYPKEKITAVCTGIRNVGTVGVNGFRTNVGALNLGRYTVHMLVNVYDGTGALVAKDIPFDVPPLGHVQDRLPTAVDGGTIEFFVYDPGANTTDFALVFPYASIVDNLSGDPVYVNPVLLASPGFLYGNAKVAMKSSQPARREIDPAYFRHARESLRHLGNASMSIAPDGTKSIVTDF